MTGYQNGKCLQKLIDLVYDASFDDKRWSELVPEIARTFNSTSVVLKAYGTDGSVRMMETTDNLVIAKKDKDWADYWHRNDLWVEQSTAIGMSVVVTSQELVPEAVFERSGFYQDWNRQLGIFHMIGTLFPMGSGSIGVLGIHRQREAGTYVDQDRRRLSDFLPHLQRALRLRTQLAEASLKAEASADALNRTGTGIVVVDAKSLILYVNRTAEDMILQTSALRIIGGRLTSAEPAIGMRLLRMVKMATQVASGVPGPAGRALAIARSGRLPVTVSAAPFRCTRGHFAVLRPAAIIFIRDPELPTLAQEALRDLFGLTRTEAAIGALVAEGRSLEIIAETLGIGIGTVRSHLKKVFAKTGTNRQAQFVSLALRCTVALDTSESLVRE